MANFSKDKRDLRNSIVQWTNEIGLISEDIEHATSNEDLHDWTTNVITFCEHVINDAQTLLEVIKKENCK